jgi:CheY-like chemotaxis protein
VVSAQHVLVVDDDADLREIIARVLREEGYSVATAASGVEALTELEIRAPDGVVLDLYMPELDGEEFLRYCRSQRAFAHLPIALCSSSARAPAVARAYGAQIISKPFDIDDLIASVAALMPLPAVISQPSRPISRQQHSLAIAAETRARTAVLVRELGRCSQKLQRSNDAVFDARSRLARLNAKHLAAVH